MPTGKTSINLTTNDSAAIKQQTMLQLVSQ